MKTRKLIALAGLALCLPACIPSLNPFYTDKDLVFDPRLVGTWAEKGKEQEPETWSFEKAGDKAYKLAIAEKPGKEGEFTAHLFKLKQEYFLDLLPREFRKGRRQSLQAGYRRKAGQRGRVYRPPLQAETGILPRPPPEGVQVRDKPGRSDRGLDVPGSPAGAGVADRAGTEARLVQL